MNRIIIIMIVMMFVLLREKRSSFSRNHRTQPTKTKIEHRAE